MVHCANENTTGLSAGFLGAAKRLSVTSSVKFGAIDCGGKLPSNKTFYERFKLPLYDFNKNKPLGFLFANGDSPLQVTKCDLPSLRVTLSRCRSPMIFMVSPRSCQTGLRRTGSSFSYPPPPTPHTEWFRCRRSSSLLLAGDDVPYMC